MSALDQRSDDDLIRRLSAEMDAATSRLHAPADGRAVVAAQVHRNRRQRRVLAGMAAVLAVVVLIGGVAAVSGMDEDSAPVITGPDVEVGPLWKQMPLLGPAAGDWYVVSWDASGEYGPSYMSNFEANGFGWTLNVGMGDFVTTGPGLAPDGDATIEETQVRVGDLDVHVTESTGVGDAADPGDVGGAELRSWVSARWIDPSGFEVSLGSARLGSIDVRDVDPAPTVDDLTGVVGSLRAVPLGEWRDSLVPPDGAKDIMSGTTDRPVRLGLPQAQASTTLSVYQPWFSTFTRITPSGSSASYQLHVGTMDDAGDGYPLTLEVPGGPRSVRGNPARLLEAPPELVGTLADDDAKLGVSWSEGASSVFLWVPDGVSGDEAMAFANSLVVLDDAELDALLFPAHVDPPKPAPARELPATTTTTAHLRPESGPPLPFLSVDGVEWRLRWVSHFDEHLDEAARGYDYVIDFHDPTDPTGQRAMSLSVGAASQGLNGDIVVTTIDVGGVQRSIYSTSGYEASGEPSPPTELAVQLPRPDGVSMTLSVRTTDPGEATQAAMIETLRTVAAQIEELPADEWLALVNAGEERAVANGAAPLLDPQWFVWLKVDVN